MNEPINFVYDDTDSYQNEISEIYSYSEETDFIANRNAFEESMEDCGLPLTWKHMVPEQKSRAINYLMTLLDVSCRTTRIKSCRALAYLIQGNFGECLTLEEQATNSQDNVYLLYEQGIFQAFVQQLLIESTTNSPGETNQQRASISSTQIFNDSAELRLILSVLCTITETMYHAKDSSDERIQSMRQQFIVDLQSPFGDELLTVTLFQMLDNFCGTQAPHYPVRKITLLLWKIILITLGGTETLTELRAARRKMCGLPPIQDDTFEITKTMRPCSPPLMPDGQARARTALSGGFAQNKRKVFKQPAFDDAVFAYAKECLLNSLAEINQADESPDDSSETINLCDLIERNRPENKSQNEEHQENNPLYGKFQDDVDEAEQKSGQQEGSNSLDSGLTTDNDSSNSEVFDIDQVINNSDHIFVCEDSEQEKNDSMIDTMPPVASSSLKVTTEDSQLDGSRSDVTSSYKGLPWAPKVRKTDLSQHLSNMRQKFLGYTLPNDLETTFGLPGPIIEGINVLKQHIYVSLSEVQLEREEAMDKYPLTHKEIDPHFRDMASEKLYHALLPRLPQYMIALLKILLAASAGAKSKSERADSLNIMSEISSDNGGVYIIQTMKMNADANRHKEIIIKSVSAILILLLKHFKINHIYQFEYVSQQLMFANCIPLILKFLSQDIYSYIVSSKSNISAIDFPACVIGEQPELTTEAIELCSFLPYSWRNMFSCINLVRTLNKLTKWKHSRIMMLVVFKSAPTLNKALSVRHSMFQLYVLKLLKVQLKFLGRQWKKTNMKLISAIYQKVRHRLTDDWAYSNDNEARPWDFQAEEFTLQANINKFHQRRYQSLLTQNNKARNSTLFNQTDKLNAFDECIDEDYDFGTNEVSQISPQFEQNYERWLESEVFQRTIDWEKLLGD